jgi:DNA-binding CsgD family transcriptional regulator
VEHQLTKDHDNSRTRNIPSPLGSLIASLRYLGLGVWLAWLYLITSGSSWLSNTDTDSSALVGLLLYFIGASAVICLLAPFLQTFYQRLLGSRPAMVVIGIMGALGSVGIVMAGPHYLQNTYIFIVGSVFAGISSALLSLRCGQVFGELRPIQTLVFSLFSELLVVALFYFVVGNNDFYPVPNGPPISGILAMVVLPVLAAWLLTLRAPAREASAAGHTNKRSDRTNGGEAEGFDAGRSPYEGDAHPINTVVRSLPSIFWKFLIVIFVFVVASLIARSFFVSMRIPVATSLDMKTALNLRMAFALIILVFLARFNRPANFGKLFLFAMVAVAIVLMLIPLLPVYNVALSSIIGFANSVLELIVWCLLATIVYEKRVSPLIVFGFGRGVLLVSQAFGWFLGTSLLPSLVGSSWEALCYLALACLILLATTLLFSEKEFGRMFAAMSGFEPADDASASPVFEGAPADHSNQQADLPRRPWLKACRQLGKQAALTTREQEVFEMIAFGRSPESISQRLFISLNTVRTHIHNIYAKLRVHSKQELMERIESERQS